MSQIVKYVGNKTAYYNDRSYFPGEVFEAPDTIPVRDSKGNPKKDDAGEPITKPLVFGEWSKIQPASEEERQKYLRENPRAARRQENEEIIDRRAGNRPFKEKRANTKENRARGLVT